MSLLDQILAQLGVHRDETCTWIVDISGTTCCRSNISASTELVLEGQNHAAVGVLSVLLLLLRKVRPWVHSSVSG